MRLLEQEYYHPWSSQRTKMPTTVDGLDLTTCLISSCTCVCMISQSVMPDSLWPMDCSRPGFPVHQLPELAQTHVH